MVPGEEGWFPWLLGAGEDPAKTCVAQQANLHRVVGLQGFWGEGRGWFAWLLGEGSAET